MSRVDHRFSDRHSISATYMYNTQSDDSVGTFGWDTRGNRARAQIATLSDVFTLTPHIVNDLHLGWHRFSEEEFFGTTNKPEYDIANIIGIAGVSRNPRDFGAPFFDAGYTLRARRTKVCATASIRIGRSTTLSPSARASISSKWALPSPGGIGPMTKV